jgi:hypothetical protein
MPNITDVGGSHKPVNMYINAEDMTALSSSAFEDMMECDRCLFMFDRNVLPSSSGSRNK